jgi:hypothetical protein
LSFIEPNQREKVQTTDPFLVVWAQFIDSPSEPSKEWYGYALYISLAAAGILGWVF